MHSHAPVAQKVDERYATLAVSRSLSSQILSPSTWLLLSMTTSSSAPARRVSRWLLDLPRQTSLFSFWKLVKTLAKPQRSMFQVSKDNCPTSYAYPSRGFFMKNIGHPDRDWAFFSQPQAHANSRAVFLPRWV